MNPFKPNSSDIVLFVCGLTMGMVVAGTLAWLLARLQQIAMRESYVYSRP